MSSQTVGAVAEMQFSLEYVKRGYIVNYPQTPTTYDFIADKKARLVKVQVKSGTAFNNGNELLVHSKKPVQANDFDVLAVFDPKSNKTFYIPVTHILGLTNIRIRLNGTSTPNSLNGNHYQKFIG
jgi:uncharacterized protein (DUF2147 family)